jgi:hypothetical protein
LNVGKISTAGNRDRLSTFRRASRQCRAFSTLESCCSFAAYTQASWMGFLDLRVWTSTVLGPPSVHRLNFFHEIFDSNADAASNGEPRKSNGRSWKIMQTVCLTRPTAATANELIPK